MLVHTLFEWVGEGYMDKTIYLAPSMKIVHLVTAGGTRQYETNILEYFF